MEDQVRAADLKALDAFQAVEAAGFPHMGEIHDHFVAVHLHAGVGGSYTGEGLDAVGVVQGQVAEPFAHLPFLRRMHLEGLVRVYQV